MRSAQLNGLDDILVARAAAQIALELLANFRLARVGTSGAQIHRAHDHAGRAKAALQAVALFEGGLHGVQGAIGLGQTFDGVT